MLIKIYSLLWISLVGAAAALYVTGNFGSIALTFFGFAFPALVFAGFVGVLPWLMERHYSRYLNHSADIGVEPRVETAKQRSAAFAVNFAN